MQRGLLIESVRAVERVRVQIRRLGLKEHPRASPRPSVRDGVQQQEATHTGSPLVRRDHYVLQLAHFSRRPGAEGEDERARSYDTASDFGDQEQVSWPPRGLRFGEHLGEGVREVLARGEGHAVVGHDLFEQTDESRNVRR